MSISLRQVVRKNQEEASMRKYYAEKYETTPPEEKQRLLDHVSTMIDKETDDILNAFTNEAWKGSTVRKKQRNLAIVNAILTAVLTVGIGYSVNIENWVMVAIFSIPLLVFQIYLISEN
ncbi:hypothetical protein [Paenibacillus xylanexedens]|uniref:ABC-type multidrug transport system fused ATPase/permease subunit n=1 Tax=Paenibacillus xylanexedens TaxID=528191 RepID=A0ABS4RXM7_PAEXY|nr:hypothetical protein [Paenibacillus xylanexedens]MBP2247166.1 ABC-type multidrug transport system fused ATPase/permease subunit [Paenibacillus xylanexedens]